MEGQLVVDVGERADVGGVFGEDLQTARLVAGERAELDVLADRRQQAVVAAGQAVAAQVVRAGLGGPSEPQQGHQGGGQHPVRLLGAGLLGRQHRLPDLQRLGVVAAQDGVLPLAVELAGAAVAYVVALGRQPVPEGPLGPLVVAHRVGEPQLSLAYGPLAVAA